MRGVDWTCDAEEWLKNHDAEEWLKNHSILGPLPTRPQMAPAAPFASDSNIGHPPQKSARAQSTPRPLVTKSLPLKMCMILRLKADSFCLRAAQTKIKSELILLARKTVNGGASYARPLSVQWPGSADSKVWPLQN